MESLGERVSRLDTEHVSTYYVDMNLTLSIEDRLVRRARKRAEAMGKSLNELIRDYLRSITDEGAATTSNAS